MKNIKVKNDIPKEKSKEKKIKRKKNQKTLIKKEKKESTQLNISPIESDKSKPVVKQRIPNIDAIRTLSMFLILLDHMITFTNIQQRNYRHHKTFYTIRTFNAMHNSLFAITSGLVGYKSNVKYSNLAYLWLMVIFYTFGCYYYYKIFKPNYFIRTQKFSVMFPVVYNHYWYFTQYFALFIFLPVVNKGVNLLSKFELKIVLLTILFLILWKDIMNPKNDVFHYVGGGSSISFIAFYLNGVYISKFRKIYSGVKKYIFCICCLLIHICSILVNVKIKYLNIFTLKGYYQMKFAKILQQIFMLRNNALPMLIQSNTIIYFLLQIKFNNILGKIVLFIGPLTFGVYLIHCNITVREFEYKNIIPNNSYNVTTGRLLQILLYITMKIYLICIIIDFIRNKIFTLLKIRNHLYAVETKFFSYFNKV